MPGPKKKRPAAWYAERAAQAVWDARDAAPSFDTKLWTKLDTTAKWLSRVGVLLAAREQKPATKTKRAPKQHRRLH